MFDIPCKVSLLSEFQGNRCSSYFHSLLRLSQFHIMHSPLLQDCTFLHPLHLCSSCSPNPDPRSTHNIITMADFPILNESNNNTLTTSFQHPLPATQTTLFSSLTSALQAIILSALTYITTMIVAAYFFIQATEAISFLVASHHGVLVRLAWVVCIGVVGMVAGFFMKSLLAAEYDDGEERW